MLDAFKKLLGIEARPARVTRRQTGGGARAARWQAKRRPAPAPPSDQPVEETCATCGAALLVDWGGTCPNCRPKLASPKTMFGARSDLRGATSLTLGWLVVLRSSDDTQRSQLLELDRSVTVLTRGSGAQPPGNFAFNDEYLSASHATVRRPSMPDRDAAFTVEDRRDPGPSANGTFVNSRRLAAGETVTLSDGDVIRVGTTELLFKSLWLPPGGYTG